MSIDVRVGAGPRRVTVGTPVGATQSARLVHEPALDGLRGLAVAAVVVFHLERLQGGFLGVDLFFVLSGYLITSLLVAEHRRTGALGLGGFWARRARRLLPALFVLLIGVSLLMLWFTPETQRTLFQDDALATLGYVANWQRLFASTSYWDLFSQPSPLDHMWSLAIEEQFYLFWPIVALLVLRRRSVGGPDDHGSPIRRLGLVALVGAVVSFVLLGLAYTPADTNWAYFATDTRIGPTLLGAALAAFTATRVRREGRPGWRLEVLGLLAVAWMVWSVWHVDGLASWYYQGGLVTFALAAVVAVWCFTGGAPGRLARVVACPPLRWLGMISYGVYLWHWPVIVYVTAARAHLEGMPLDVLRVVLTLALAVASFLLVERPLRRGRFDPTRLRVVAAGACAMTLVCVVVATSGASPSQSGGPGAVGMFDESDDWVKVHRHLPRDVPPGTPKLLVVGDSAIANLGPELRRAGPWVGISVGFSSEGFCSLIYTDNVTLGPDGKLWARNNVCGDERRAIWRAMIERFDPDVVIQYLANAGTGHKQRLDGEWVTDCDEAYDDYLHEGLTEDIEMLQAGGATVVFATTPYSSRETAGEQADADVEVDCRNDTYQDIIDAHPGTQMIDLNAFVEEQRAATGSDLFLDTVHLDRRGLPLVAKWLIAQAQPLLPAAAPTSTTSMPGS